MCYSPSSQWRINIHFHTILTIKMLLAFRLAVVNRSDFWLPRCQSGGAENSAQRTLPLQDTVRYMGNAGRPKDRTGREGSAGGTLSLKCTLRSPDPFLPSDSVPSVSGSHSSTACPVSTIRRPIVLSSSVEREPEGPLGTPSPACRRPAGRPRLVQSISFEIWLTESD